MTTTASLRTSPDEPVRAQRRRGSRPSGLPTAAAPVTPIATPPAPAESRGFAELGVPARLVAALAAGGITSPFPIQVETLPDTLAGRDVLGRGRTGSGKTLAFSLPMVARLTQSGTPRTPKRPRALVLVPTRELANQVLAVLRPLADAAQLRATVVFGGVSQVGQVSELGRGVDILVACPGRLEDLIKQGLVRLDAVEITVLDEADHMADLGFLPVVKRLLDTTPKVGQRMLFSATLDNGVDVLVRRYLHDPVTHAVDPAVAPVAAMTHHMLAVSADDKPGVVRELAGGQDRSLLFTRTKHGAKQLAKKLTAAGVPAVDLHGNLSQNARERNLAAFTGGGVKVLVATDIAARGIHVDDIALVVHVDPPTEHKAYLHRSGRTARAGAGGSVVTLVLPEQASDVRLLAKQAGVSAQHTPVRPGAPVLRSLTGPPAEHVTPAPVAPVPPAGDGSRRSAGRPKAALAPRTSRTPSARGAATRAPVTYTSESGMPAGYSSTVGSSGSPAPGARPARRRRAASR